MAVWHRALWVLMGFLLTLWAVAANATPPSKTFHRSFWSPTYHMQRLSYCTRDGRECGLPVATQYCKLLGYEASDKALIEYNVGLTHYFPTGACCKGCRCHGFQLIRCKGPISHKPASRYYYRSMRFDLPRFEGSRVDWCYDKEKGCGQRAAYSFCRRMGYSKAAAYQHQPHVPVTRTIGSKRLCMGKVCQGFRYITCYR